LGRHKVSYLPEELDLEAGLTNDGYDKDGLRKDIEQSK
jgi:hypothetical protein